jgi:hypothetical protein
MIRLCQQKRNWVIDFAWLSCVHFLDGVGAVGGLNEPGTPSVGRELTPNVLKDAGLESTGSVHSWGLPLLRRLLSVGTLLCMLEVCERDDGRGRSLFVQPAKSVSASNYPPGRGGHPLAETALSLLGALI